MRTSRFFWTFSWQLCQFIFDFVAAVGDQTKYRCQKLWPLCLCSFFYIFARRKCPPAYKHTKWKFEPTIPETWCAVTQNYKIQRKERLIKASYCPRSGCVSLIETKDAFYVNANVRIVMGQYTYSFYFDVGTNTTISIFRRSTMAGERVRVCVYVWVF